MNADGCVLFPLEKADDDDDADEEDEDNNEMVSAPIGIGLLFEINGVEARIGQGCVDLSTAEGHFVDERQPRRSRYVIIESWPSCFHVLDAWPQAA